MNRNGIINFETYEDDVNYLGIANIQLPTFTSKTLTVNGAGISGDVDLPALGQYNAAHTTITFTNSSADARKLLENLTHLITCRVANEGYSPVSGKLLVRGDKVVMRIIPIT